MSIAVLLDALRKTAQKKKLASTVFLAAIDQLEQSETVTGAEALHAWLATGKGGIDRRTGRKLAQCLVPPGRPPFGDYSPLTHLADGGMGSVWLAADPGGKLVVVKTLKKDLGESQDLAYRFQREARITQELDHPAAVRSIDAGQASDGTLFMVLEYVDAGDLQEVVEAAGGLSEIQALSVLHQATGALAMAHDMHLVHRDIKPANIFVSADGSAKLADFGIARSTEATRTMLTMQGAIIGSPLYMSPEQVMGESDLDIRCDLYAMGAVLYFCMSGEPPYYARGGVQEIMHLHCEAPVPDISEPCPDAHKLTVQIIKRCMAKRRDDRYPHPKAMLKDLAKVLKKLGQKPAEPVPLPVHLVEEAHRQQGDAATGDANDATIATDLGGDDAAATDATMAADWSGDPAAATIATDLGGSAGLLTEAAVTAATMAQQPAPDQEAETRADPVTDSRAETLLATPTPLPGADPDATIADSGFGAGDDATLATDAPAPVDESTFLSKAFAGDWLVLRSPYAKDPTSIVCYARTRITMGKLCETPCDCGLRYYPVQTHRPAVQRVSRQHCAIAYDNASHMVQIEDLGSANGSLLDGRTLTGEEPVDLDPAKEHFLLLAGVVSLTLRALPARGDTPATVGELPPSPTQRCGLDTGLRSDAVIIDRPDNRPEMHYVLALRRFTVGGEGCDVIMEQVPAGQGAEIALWHGHWCWRVLGDDGDFHPLTVPGQITVGNRQLLCEAGTHEHLSLDP